ncbi:MAG: hypothetical protein AB2A00_17830 [Myxococcota bacterium]
MLHVMARAALLWGILLAVVQLGARRAAGRAGSMDFVVALLLGDVLDNTPLGEATLRHFVVAAAALGVAHVFMAWARHLRGRLAPTLRELHLDEPPPLHSRGSELTLLLHRRTVPPIPSAVWHDLWPLDLRARPLLPRISRARRRRNTDLW